MHHDAKLERIFQQIQNKPELQNALKEAAEHDHSMQQIQSATSERLAVTNEINLADVAFSTIEHYGSNHALEVSQLAHVIGASLNLNAEQLRVVRAAAFFHDIGREKDWRSSDPEHNKRSAYIAERTLRSRKDGHGDASFIEQVCHYVAHHAVGQRFDDPVAQALHDADALDAARFAPGTTTGMMRLKSATGSCLTAFGRDRDNIKRWMQHRGW